MVWQKLKNKASDLERCHVENETVPKDSLDINIQALNLELTY